MRGLRLLTLGDFVFVLSWLNSAQAKALLEAKPLLAPWVPGLASALADASQAPRDVDGAEAHPIDDDTAASPAPAQAPSPPALKPLDRIAEASVRALRGGLRLGQDQALSQGDAADAARWEQAEATLLPKGIGFLSFSLPEQVGETLRLLARAQSPEVAWLHTRWSAHNQTLSETLAAIKRSNDTLNDALTTPAAPTPTVNLVALRRRLQVLLSDLLPIIERTYPEGDEDASAARKALLKPLQERLTFRITRQAQQKKQQAPDKQAPNKQAPDQQAPDQQAPDQQAPDQQADSPSTDASHQEPTP
jgi:hypothetical protein